MAPELSKRQDAAKAIVASQEALVDALIQLAGRESKPVRKRGGEILKVQGTPIYHHGDAKYFAITLLGELRAARAVPVLLDNIEYRTSRSLITSLRGKGQNYPAARALGKIGIPAIRPVLEKLGKYDKDVTGRAVCAWLMEQILGQRLAKVRLELAIEQADRDLLKVKSRNLRAAIPHFAASEAKSTPKNKE